MKELFGQTILVVILLCASVALVGSMTGWIDFGRVIKTSLLSPTATGPQHSASNSVSTQPPAEPKAPEPKPKHSASNSLSAQPPAEQKSPEPSPIIPAVTAPVAAPTERQAIEQRPSEQQVAAQAAPPAPEARAARPPILETGYDQLKGLGREANGYGLYSYGVLTAASPRSAAFLAEIFKSMPSIGDTAAARTQVNIFYVPTKKDKVANLAALVEASRGDQTKMAVRYSEAMYDYKMARAILIHLCNPPPKPMTSLCKSPMSGGPYILTNARPASSLEPVPPPFLFVDLSDINPHAYPEFISAFRAVAKQEDLTDDAKLHSLRLKVLNLALTAADWSSKAKRPVIDIVHSFDSLPDGQAFR
jgi:hypothetical protein